MKRKSVERLAGELAEWVKRPRNREILLDAGSLGLRDYLAGKPCSPAGPLSKVASPIASLRKVSAWFGNIGAHSVLYNEHTGWRDIRLSLEYGAWNERVLFAMLGNGTANRANMTNAAFMLTHAIAFRYDRMADWFGNRLLSAIEKREKKVTAWNMGPFYSFAVRLFAKWRQIRFPTATPEMSGLGIYENLLGTWSNEADFATALAAASDYHVQRAFDDYDEFFRSLYRNFPVEILAIGRVRADEGLTMPAIDHPLMQTPLANPPAQIPLEKGELLEAVCAENP